MENEKKTLLKIGSFYIEKRVSKDSLSTAQKIKDFFLSGVISVAIFFLFFHLGLRFIPNSWGVKWFFLYFFFSYVIFIFLLGFILFRRGKKYMATGIIVSIFLVVYILFYLLANFR